MRKLFVVMSFLVVASMLITACGGAGTSQTEVKPAVLRINLLSYPDIIDPQKSSFNNEIVHLTLMYQGLTTFNDKLETIPGAAEKWVYNADGTGLTFTLRKDLKYSDGTLLNAKRFEYALKRNVNPETAGEYAAITDEILNAPEWRSGDSPTCAANVALPGLTKTADDAKAAAEVAKTAAEAAKTAAEAAPEDTKLADDAKAADDAAKAADDAAKAAADAVAAAPTGCTDEEKAAFEAGLGVKASHADGAACADYEDVACDTLTLTFSKPAPYFHTIMGIWVAFPAKEENIAEGGDNWWNSSKFQVGNGPYILESLEPFVRGYFVPNPNYAGDKAKVDIEYSYITDTAVAFEAYKNNEFDIIAAAAEDIATIKADATLSTELNQYPGSCTFAVMLHQQKEPFTDPKVREAFTMAFDREGWVRDVLKDVGLPTQTWIPKGYPGYKEGETRWPFDPEKAKAALAASTYGSVDKLPEITLTFSDTPRNRTRNEWIAAKWKEVLGLDVKLNPVESTTYTSLTKDVKTAPQTFILGWCADYPDPQNWLSVYWKTGGFGERIAYSNKEFDDLVNAADVELDPVKRAELYQKAQDVLLDSNPGTFAWNNINSYLVKPWVKGFVTTPQDSAWIGQTNPEGITIDTSMMP